MALMQCPADSFLGAGVGLLQSRVPPGRNGSATASGAVAVCRGREDQGGSHHVTSARPGLRRLAGWRLACGTRGGHGNAGDGNPRRGDAGIDRSVWGVYGWRIIRLSVGKK